MIRFSQQDPRWKNEKLGKGAYTIGNSGCLVTCVAMACQKFGYGETPATVNAKFEAVGGFSGSLISLWKTSSAIPGVNCMNNLPCYDPIPAPVETINQYLADGKAVIALVDYEPETPVLDNHWVVLEQAMDDDYIIFDPWPLAENGGPVSLMNRYGKGKRHVREAIYDVFVFGSESPAMPESPSIPLPAQEPQGGQAAELPKAGDVLRPIMDYVNDRYPNPSTASLDVADIPATQTVTLSADAVTMADGSVWGPHTVTHWVCVRKANGTVLMEKAG